MKPALDSNRPKGDLMNEIDRLREALREIASKATQGYDTKLGGPILREIEIIARDALGQQHGHWR
jgi:hypothetical protein